MKVISTWFYTHGEGEPGSYAQMRGDVASEIFRDVYRRCIAVFFSTARLVEPTARLILFSNVPWDASASRVSREVQTLLDRLNVEVIQLPYSHEPPASWPAAWRNQFFVIDVLKWAAESLASDDQLLILDSDIVWTGSPRTPDMWRHLQERGGLALRIDYSADEEVNSMSRREMTRRMADLPDATQPLPYCGGEFVALSGAIIPQYYREAASVMSTNVVRSAGGAEYSFEEAHVLSVANSRLGIEAGSANSFVRRMWTQPLKFKNVNKGDLALVLWHLPAEKRYGIRRLYRKIVADNLSSATLSTIGIMQPMTIRTLGSFLGVPRNSPAKWVRDVARASLGKLRAKL
ncbi:hypothetical protein [uncultured Microbacterium sp.]|uniref:hypothetical protein n=1 Tax=uncultured Microbacterium sp. TaxID=191216 RepID=UPI0025FF3CE3|nr:hypothetical protein [uncultured Microbacterium sp.]